MPAQFLLQCVDAPKLVIEPPVRKAPSAAPKIFLRGVIRNAASVVFCLEQPFK
jgi:hypothetical protein